MVYCDIEEFRASQPYGAVVAIAFAQILPGGNLLFAGKFPDPAALPGDAHIEPPDNSVMSHFDRGVAQIAKSLRTSLGVVRRQSRNGERAGTPNLAKTPKF